MHKHADKNCGNCTELSEEKIDSSQLTLCEAWHSVSFFYTSLSQAFPKYEKKQTVLNN